MSPTFSTSGLDAKAIIDLVARSLPEKCKLAVFDHVTSNEAMLLPVAELTKLCQKRG